jgi:hypothetical protein
MEPPRDEPLPATVFFVFTMGIVFLLGWFGMFVLLRERW